jgi:hypothetical protein
MPGEDRLAVTVNSNGKQRLYTIDLDGRHPRPVSAPDEFVYTTNVVERFPDQEGVGRESARREDIERGLLTLFVQRTSWLFYRHIEDKYPDIRK